MDATQLPRKHLMILGILSVTGPIRVPALTEILNKGKPERGEGKVPYTPRLVSRELHEMYNGCALKLFPVEKEQVEGEKAKEAEEVEVGLSAVGKFFLETHRERREVRRGIRTALDAT